MRMDLCHCKVEESLCQLLWYSLVLTKLRSGFCLTWAKANHAPCSLAADSQEATYGFRWVFTH